MRVLFISILLLSAFIANAQEYNKYLLKKQELKGKLKGNYYLMTEESILGDLSNGKLGSKYMWNSNPQYSYIKEEQVAVYIDKLDAAKADITSLDTAGIVYNKYENKRVAFGRMNSFGKFTLPPVYTNFTFVNGSAIYGRKLKNGNWQGASTAYNAETKSVEYISLPENKDYTLLSQNLILFRDLKNKYGLMDGNGNILADAIYDTCLAVFNYYIYRIDTKEKVTSKSWIKDQPVSLQKNFTTANSYMAPNIIQLPGQLPVFMLKNKEFTILASAKYVTKPVKNAVISSHFLSNSNQPTFYFVKHNKDDYDIITDDGDRAEEKYKYAYLESIKRDTTRGLDSKWNFDEKADYSEPFKGYSVDSLRLATYKKQYDEEQKLKAERADYIKRIEASSNNYTTVMTGTYENIKWEEGGNTYTGKGSGYDEMMSVKTEDMNIIKVAIYMKAKTSQYDPLIHNLDLTATLSVEPAVLKSRGIGTNANDVNGYRLFQPETKAEKPDFEKLSKEYKQDGRQKIFVKSMSGTYNPVTREIYIMAEKTFGGFINITAKKK